MTPTDLANEALSALGEPGLVDLETDRSPQAISARRHYERTRDALLRKHPWNFAATRVALSALPDPPAFGWSQAFVLPSDCLRVTSLNGAPALQGEADFVIEGDHLLTNADAALIVYIRRETDPAKFDAIFREVLAFRLAAAMAMDITGSSEKRQEMEAMAQARLSAARFVDAVETRPRVMSPLNQSRGIAARGNHAMMLAMASMVPGSAFPSTIPVEPINGWTPIPALVEDGSRLVIQIVGWTGGDGPEPSSGFVGSSGIVSSIEQAVNVRGDFALSLGVYPRGEAISGARAVRLAEVSGETRVFAASAMALDEPAVGFVIEAGPEGADVMVWESGPLTGVSGIVPGARYFLGGSGEFLPAPPAGAVVIQRLGIGATATKLFGRVDAPVTLRTP